jgi:hypothetical protein
MHWSRFEADFFNQIKVPYPPFAVCQAPSCFLMSIQTYHLKIKYDNRLTRFLLSSSSNAKAFGLNKRHELFNDSHDPSH